MVSEVDRGACQCHSWQQDETQHQTLEQCPLPLGLDQGVVEDEDVSVEADAYVDEPVDESEEEGSPVTRLSLCGAPVSPYSANPT